MFVLSISHSWNMHFPHYTDKNVKEIAGRTTSAILNYLARPKFERAARAGPVQEICCNRGCIGNTGQPGQPRSTESSPAFVTKLLLVTAGFTSNMFLSIQSFF